MGLLYLALVNYYYTNKLISCDLNLKDTGAKIMAIRTYFKVIHLIPSAFLLYAVYCGYTFSKLELSTIVKVSVVTIRNITVAKEIGRINDKEKQSEH